tara:strand:- start:134 stop:697 length:564 start_codon:yes stop_codon:yes gene_type:complete
MAEAFTNKIVRAVGIVSTFSTASIGVGASAITSIETTHLNVGDLVVNQHFRSGAKIYSITNATSLIVDRTSTNTSAATNQIVKVLGVTTAFTASGTEKSILIGGTFANLTENDVNIYVEIVDQSLAVAGAAGISSVQLASDIPIPNGSSFVISEAGKTVLEQNDQVTIYCDTANAVDVTLAILSGVS